MYSAQFPVVRRMDMTAYYPLTIPDAGEFPHLFLEPAHMIDRLLDPGLDGFT